MNTFVADPHWRGWIVWYFFLGGIAAGAYFMAALVELAGNDRDRALAKVAYYLAFPLIVLCGVLLILDLGQPLRFWHMLVQSETGRPMFKHWSPMSIGSWGLVLFSALSGLSFLGVLAEDRRAGLARFARLSARLGRGPPATALRIAGALAGFFVASYTGALLTATNQPIWSDSPWLAALFLSSSASTGIAAMQLAAQLRGGVEPGSIERLARADAWLIVLEAATGVVFLVSLGDLALVLLASRPGVWLVGGTAVLGLAIPWLAHLRPGLLGRGTATVASVLVLAGGLALRYAILAAAPAMLAKGK